MIVSGQLGYVHGFTMVVTTGGPEDKNEAVGANRRWVGSAPVCMHGGVRAVLTSPDGCGWLPGSHLALPERQWHMRGASTCGYTAMRGVLYRGKHNPGLAPGVQVAVLQVAVLQSPFLNQNPRKLAM